MERGPYRHCRATPPYPASSSVQARQTNSEFAPGRTISIAEGRAGNAWSRSNDEPRITTSCRATLPVSLVITTERRFFFLSGRAFESCSIMRENASLLAAFRCQ